MNLKELSSPIRMYWDIDPDRVGEPDLRRIAGEIAAAKILSLQIACPGPGAACLSVLEALKDKPVALSLVLPLAAYDVRAQERISRFPVRLLLLSTSDPASVNAVTQTRKQIESKPPVGLAFCVTRENFRSLPDVLRFCVEQRIETLVLPMQRVTGAEAVFSFSGQERRELTDELSRIERPAWLKIFIHDPFLWRAFFPAVEFPDGGCQAANTMLYISPEARVYPCPTMPITIGDLWLASLADVIRSEVKKDIRQKILSVPPRCSACPEQTQCKGGCRGRARALNDSLDANDPACV